MIGTDEERLKAKCAEEYVKQQARNYSDCGGTGLGQACRQSLRDRVESQKYRAEVEANRAAGLHELASLLDRNPDVARILDLLDQEILHR